MSGRNIHAELTYRDYLGQATGPLPGQARFHCSRAVGRLYAGGYGAGKTAAGAIEAWATAIANSSTDGLLVAPYYSTLGSVVLDSFRSLAPRGIELRDHRDARDRYLETPWGTRIYYRSADNEASLEGLTVGWAWIDEARYCSHAAFVATLGRLRGHMTDGGPPRWWLTSTPNMGWLHEEFGGCKAGREIVRASTRENVHNPPEFLAGLRTSFSDKLQRQVVEGEFVLLEGAVYADEFDRALHLIHWGYDPRLRTVVAWDFGKRAPYACFIQEVSEHVTTREGRKLRPGDAVVLAEIVRDEISTEAFAQLVRGAGYRIDAIYCDPAGDASQAAYGLSDIHILRAAGLPTPRFVTEPRLRYIPNGIARVGARLRNARGETSLYFATGLDSTRSPRGMLRAIVGYRYPEQKASEQPVKDGITDHAMDALRYYVLNAEVASSQLVKQVPAR